MKIDINKKYRTRAGNSVTILSTTAKISGFPVIALILREDDSESVECFTKNGRYYYSADCGANNNDLLEVNLFDDFKVDDPVLVRDCEQDLWSRGHFAGVNSDGLPMAFKGGCTSYTCIDGETPVTWNYCVKFTGEEA